LPEPFFLMHYPQWIGRDTELTGSRQFRDAHIESAIPEWFAAAADAVGMVGALALNLWLAPALQHLFAPGGVLHLSRLDWLGLPETQLKSTTLFPEYLGMLLVTVPVTLLAIRILGGYRPLEQISRTRFLGPAIVGPFAGLSAFALVVLALHNTEWSRVFLFGYTALSVTMLLAYRVALRTYKLRRIAAGRYARATAFVGRADDIAWVVDRLAGTKAAAQYRPVGCFTPDEARVLPGGLPKLGAIADLSAMLVRTPIEMVVIVLPATESPWLSDVIRACDYMRVAVQVTPLAVIGLTNTLSDLRVVEGFHPLPLPGVFLQSRNIDSGALFLKRLVDATVAGVLLVLLSPVFLLIALAIKITSPRQHVFYRWRVIGYQGRPFTGYKFTTMVDDADQRREELGHLNEMTGPVFKIKNDPRVTPLGRLLRKFSLNELPQLWSVLVGDMSLVGPRPAGAWEIGNYEDWHKRKLSFRPGITCLWQVRGRNKISNFDDWVRMDLEYIDNWSLWLDTRILIRTAWAVVAGSGS
jgi:exopolysaccharide biosynthesis polyprenyl glycosylphosphotransferase